MSSVNEAMSEEKQMSVYLCDAIGGENEVANDWLVMTAKEM